MKHSGTVPLQTERLTLRPFRTDDAAAMFKNWTNDDEVSKFLRWPTHESIEISEAVARDWESHNSDSDFYQWAICLQGNEPIGSIGVVEQNERTKMLHIGYCIGRKWWRQGITSESLAAVIRYLFTTTDVNRIESLHDPLNPNSGKVMLKCGMKYEGTMRQADFSNQGICDAAMYSILREEYQF